jgi:hypothetical protein
MIVIIFADQDIGCVRRDDVFLRFESYHHAWHAAGETAGGRVIAKSAIDLIRHSFLPGSFHVPVSAGLINLKGPQPFI